MNNNPSKQQYDLARNSKKFDDPALVNGYDYIVCQLCGLKRQDIGGHIVKLHNITSEEYKLKYAVDSTKCQKLRDNRKGSKNPAYQHGGRLSAWSTKFVHGYDEERHQDAKKKHRDWVKANKNRNKFAIEYWLEQANGDMDKAQELYIKSQTRDLSWFVNKYGEEEGKKRHQDKIDKWQQTLNAKSIDELQEINSRKIRKSFCFFSKLEKELFLTLKEQLPQLTEQLSLCIDVSAEKKKFFVYDMSLGNKIIEFNGDFWHANPTLYTEDFINPYNKRSRQQINERDASKLEVASKNGYTLLTIWENEYKNDPKETIERCLKFLTA